jgi:hypothetical protein
MGYTVAMSAYARGNAGAHGASPLVVFGKKRNRRKREM